jgi:hypothetical protein
MKLEGPLVPPTGGETQAPPDGELQGPPDRGETQARPDRAPVPDEDGRHADVPLGFRAAFAVRDLRAGGLLALLVAASGVPLGLLWAAVGPRASVMLTSDGAVLAEHSQEAFVGADGTFAAIGLGAGFVAGAAAYLWRRGRGPWTAIGLAAGSLAGAWVAWKVGHQVGLSAYQRLLESEPAGQEFERPVDLRAHGALFVEPIVAVIVYVLAAGWSRFGDLGRVTSPGPETERDPHADPALA